MKIILTLFVLFFSSSVVAERINCSYIFNDEPRGFFLERSGDNFEWTTRSNKNFFLEILFETEDNLVLGGLFNYDNYKSGDALYVLFYDKKLNIYRSTTLPHPQNKKMKPQKSWSEGNCIVN